MTFVIYEIYKNRLKNQKKKGNKNDFIHFCEIYLAYRIIIFAF